MVTGTWLFVSYHYVTANYKLSEFHRARSIYLLIMNLHID